MGALPYLRCALESALDLGGTLILASPEAVEQAEVSRRGTAVRVERMLFAFRIPYFPDVLASPDLSGPNERERLIEVLDRQRRLVASLAHWKGRAVALRYLARPERGEVEVTVVARGLARAGGGQRLGEQMAGELAAVLGGFGLPVEPVLAADDLATVLEPISQPLVVELRQHADLVHMRSGDAYVVYPFGRPTSTWLSAFEALLRQPVPCLVSIYLEPTQLSAVERRLFAQAAGIAASQAEQTFQMFGHSRRIADPEAAHVAHLYGDYIERLVDPFLVLVQVASADLAAACAVARAFGAELAEGGNGAVRETGPELVEPREMDDLEAAWRTLHQLDLRAWGASEARPEQVRMRYLADAQTASAAFRFPVAIRGGIPGIKTRQPLPAFDQGSRSEAVGPEEVSLGRFAERGGAVGVPLGLFTRHALVAGTTGSGKTTTCMHLLSELWEQGVPFLVIEPAKGEYRALLDSPLGPDLRVFTLGDEGVSPFRLNPLELLPGIGVESHVSALRACFEAALPTFGVLPSLIEEAHRVMAATPRAGNREVMADTRAEATAMFSSTLSEVREFGEGLIIAEQIPGRLAEDALKNTNVKIVHRLSGAGDRQAIGATMSMSPEQGEYLAKLVPGTASLFMEGYERSTFITVPDYRAQHGLPERVADERVEQHMAGSHLADPEVLLPFDGCHSCLRRCRYRDRVTPVAYDVRAAERFRSSLGKFEHEHRRGNTAAGWSALVKACRDAVSPLGLGHDEHAAYCYFTHLWSHALPSRTADEFRREAARGES